MRNGRKVNRQRQITLAAAGLWLAGSLIAAVAGSTPGYAGPDVGQQVALVSPEATDAPVADAPKPFVEALIDLSDQTMSIYVDDRLTNTFPVSTGRGSHRTPTGSWQAQWLSPHHRSKKYHNAPMPWSVFFYRGYAIHGTTEISRLGRPASHGCIRLHPDNAKIFYDLVRESGTANTLVSVVN